jgi:hypothetical protein
MTDTFIRFAGYTGYANAALTILNIATIIIFFSIGGFWGKLNDGVSVLWALSFIPLAMVMYRLNSEVNPQVSLLAVIIGISSMLVFAVLQSLLFLGQLSFEQTESVVLSMTGVIGISLVINGLLAGSGGTLPSGLVWLTVTFGLGFVFGGIGFWIGRQQHPVAVIGFLVTVLVGPVWAIWLGRLLLNGTLFAPAAAGAGGLL